MKKEIKQIILGGVSPIIGILVFLIQLHINPYGKIRYMIIQSMITTVFLLYFFLCAYFISKKSSSKNGLWFFVVPSIFCLSTILFERIQENPLIAIFLSGVAAPFHYVIPYLHFPIDKYNLIPNAFPIIICMIAFKIGERVSIWIKERGRTENEN